MTFEQFYFKESIKYKPTKEMIGWFDERTNLHVNLVKKYANKLYEQDPIKYKDFIKQAENHDKSKFEEPEYTPYIFISWRYRCKDLGKKFEYENIDDELNKATLHHIKNNSHHPEYFDSNSEINKKDRDSIPDNIVDATKMTDNDIAEMVCDWCAMSEERHNDVKDWADKTVNKKWKFNNKQVELIYDLIKNLNE